MGQNVPTSDLASLMSQHLWANLWITNLSESIKNFGWTCQNSVVGAAEYRQSVGVQSVGVLDVRMQGSKTQLKLM